MTTGLVWHERYMWHDIGNYAGVLPPRGYVQPGEHFENAETKRRMKNLLDISGLSDKKLAKLKKKGINPQLYMEMKAARGGKGKLVGPLVGNTYIG